MRYTKRRKIGNQPNKKELNCYSNSIQILRRRMNYLKSYLGYLKIQKINYTGLLEKVRQAGFKSFNTISRTIENHYQTILNYFDNRSTNASAESFNAKIKAFRAQFRGVRNVEFFLFRLTNIYAKFLAPHNFRV